MEVGAPPKNWQTDEMVKRTRRKVETYNYFTNFIVGHKNSVIDKSKRKYAYDLCMKNVHI